MYVPTEDTELLQMQLSATKMNILAAVVCILVQKLQEVQRRAEKKANTK